MQGISSHTQAKTSIYSLKSIKGYSPDKSKLKQKEGATIPSEMKRGMIKGTKITHQFGRNGYEHQTQSCQLEKEFIDQENRSDQKMEDHIKCQEVTADRMGGGLWQNIEEMKLKPYWVQSLCFSLQCHQSPVQIQSKRSLPLMRHRLPGDAI